ncbi:MAG: spore coat protein CotJB [Ruminococcus sp.]|jgi:spore coat protein JB|nr:spore coat protein CotJB [Ruminococcus sp.]
MTMKNLMLAIQMYDFYLNDIKLFLDTHPTDKEALATYKKYKHLRDNAVSEYVQNWGPIVANNSVNAEKFSWVNNPWPWERSAN